MKIASLYQGLIRKGLITSTDELTVNGTELLAFLETKGESGKKFIKKKPATAEFEQWYKTFPGTDTFTHRGRTFTGSRSLRHSKDDCRMKFEKILLEGEYTATELIEALKYDVLQKKEASVSENTNKLKYMQNSLTYLNQRSYESFIELIKEKGSSDIELAPSGSTDI